MYIFFVTRTFKSKLDIYVYIVILFFILMTRENETFGNTLEEKRYTGMPKFLLLGGEGVIFYF